MRYDNTAAGSSTVGKAAGAASSARIWTVPAHLINTAGISVGVDEPPGVPCSTVSITSSVEKVAESEPMTSSDPTDREISLAEAVREACFKAALDAYEDASIRGICHEGAWECAVGAMRSLDVDALVEELKARRQST